MSSEFERFLAGRRVGIKVSRQYPSIMDYIRGLEDVQKTLENMAVEMAGTGLLAEREHIIAAIRQCSDAKRSLERLKGLRR